MPGAVNKGLDLILKAQYPTGAAAVYPPDEQYHRFITFNDDAMRGNGAFARVALSPD